MRIGCTRIRRKTTWATGFALSDTRGRTWHWKDRRYGGLLALCRTAASMQRQHLCCLIAQLDQGTRVTIELNFINMGHVAPATNEYSDVLKNYEAKPDSQSRMPSPDNILIQSHLFSLLPI